MKHFWQLVEITRLLLENIITRPDCVLFALFIFPYCLVNLYKCCIISYINVVNFTVKIFGQFYFSLKCTD